METHFKKPLYVCFSSSSSPSLLFLAASLSDDDDDGDAALSVLLSSKGRRVDTSRIDEDTTRGFDRLIKISAASDLRYFYSLIRFFPIGGDHETERAFCRC